MWLALTFFVVSFFVCCYWMWQRPEPEPKPHPKEYAS